ncbi:MAG: hypothetical protein AAGA65_16850 [Actinomycetota bacterium]
MMHSNVLDSRSIGLGDAFGQRFMKPGIYRYNLDRPGGGRMSDEYPYEIRVNESPADHAMHQETVLVGYRKRRLSPDRPQLDIQVGDLVVWAPTGSDVPRFEVAGEQEFFGSAVMQNECGYSHAFGLSGTYRWRDATGGPAMGVVKVKDPKVDTTSGLERWKKKLANAQLVMIHDGKVDPAEVSIEMGQTVYFAVVNGTGVTVTDEQLLAGDGTYQDKPKDQDKPTYEDKPKDQDKPKVKKAKAKKSKKPSTQGKGKKS